ncbi:AroE: shikimate dehydrogenase [Desulfosarcina variabilis str. Montpellier]|uniref:shikimate dehydrogenase n=1 Tax=Desulfosarcina variabilis TaxID=2300 RepID=UPI003AFB480E
MDLPTISPRTRLYAVMGDPVAHSLSPLMHNAAFAQTGIDGVYVAFHVTDLAGAVAGIRALNVSGCSVTIPHKVAIMDLIDEVDPTARQIGAVNTIVNDAGRLIGLNSDSPGAMAALLEKTPVAGRHTAVIGAGGAARAVAYGINHHGGRLTIVNRSPDKGRRLADELDGAFVGLDEFTGEGIDILVNTTSVGMTPAVDQMPVARECLRTGMTVMDIVYNPIDTLLLQTARQTGCQVVDGVAMFVHQGAIQFERWTGQTAPVQLMRDMVLEALNTK